MKQYHTCVSIILTTILVLLLEYSSQIIAQSAESISADRHSSLTLPSFSIFEASRMWTLLKPEEPLVLQELEKLVSVLAESATESVGISGGESVQKDPRYSMIPIILYKSRMLFEKNQWTEEEIQQGKAISRFFASVFDQPELEISQPDQQTFRTGLRKIKVWFEALCKDDHTLGMMIFTMDDGPFWGKEVDSSRLSALEKITFTPIPEKDANIVLLTDNLQEEPMIVAVMDKEENLVSAVGLTGEPVGIIENVSLLNKQPVQKLQDFGYKVSFVASWTYGNEFMHLYLDNFLHIRFYFVSW